MVNLTAMTFDLVSLMPGTLHSVQVFPVKCERDLNPEEVSFYTSKFKEKKYLYLDLFPRSDLGNTLFTMFSALKIRTILNAFYCC